MIGDFVLAAITPLKDRIKELESRPTLRYLGVLGCIADVSAGLLHHAWGFGLACRRGKHRRSAG
ncbi:hypothetical protein JWS04_14560 [Bradyrhizobium vignae]|uniref:Uncharacterized protein n=1 Tax=Bradyrhizobium vignae TaxID=1549949 RepID=A0ABS3ZVV5_9BRAD|nr:hypothetical protein [Bradyrhizobium vignae]